MAKAPARPNTWMSGTSDVPPVPVYRPQYLRVRRVEALKAPDLKALIVDAGRAGYLTTAEAEDLISFYGLRNA